MLRPQTRRGSFNPAQVCAILTFLILLLFSLSLLHFRLHKLPSYPSTPSSDLSSPLFDDADNDAFDGTPDDDRIDLLDLPDSLPSTDDSDPDPESDDPPDPSEDSSSTLFFDHSLAVYRRSFGKPEPDPIPFQDPLSLSFSSDDLPLDDRIRSLLHSVNNIEDLLMVKTGSSDNPLRDGWSRWLEGKGDFLRRDRMLKSNLEVLNPKNHPLLQDPDVVGLSGLTRGDRLVQRSILKEMERVRVPFGAKVKKGEMRRGLRGGDEGNVRRRRWGYFKGIEEGVGFDEFMGKFFFGGEGECGVRVLMVWNSPAWMFGVRHQRGVESVFKVHRDACVVVLSETLEMDFFESFVQDGYKIAVAMPDLDELLKDTPTRDFASAWFEWRKTKHYPVHYSELIRLAALYKYGGIYLDSDVIVLKPLYSLKNTVGVENQMDGSPIFNGAVMAFDKDSPFLMECLKEFYSTYDDALLRWNGADLLTRVINRIYGKGDIKMEDPFSFFPINSVNITRYFALGADEIERSQEETLYAKILNESTAFHFWNSLTSALVPEPNSVVDRLFNHNCLRCLDIL